MLRYETVPDDCWSPRFRYAFFTSFGITVLELARYQSFVPQLVCQPGLKSGYCSFPSLLNTSMNFTPFQLYIGLVTPVNFRSPSP